MAKDGKRGDPAKAAHARKMRAEKLAKMSDQEKTVFLQQERMEKFKKLAGIRVSRALRALTGVKQLGNRKKYGYTTEDTAKIFTVLNDRLKDAYNRFQDTTEQTRRKEEFSL